MISVELLTVERENPTPSNMPYLATGQGESVKNTAWFTKLKEMRSLSLSSATITESGKPLLSSISKNERHPSMGKLICHGHNLITFSSIITRVLFLLGNHEHDNEGNPHLFQMNQGNSTILQHDI